MSSFIVGGGKSDFRESWGRQNRLFPIGIVVWASGPVVASSRQKKNEGLNASPARSVHKMMKLDGLLGLFVAF